MGVLFRLINYLKTVLGNPAGRISLGHGEGPRISVAEGRKC